MLTLEKIITVLKGKHGETLFNNKDNVFYLHFKDAVACVYLDEDSKTVKVEFEFLPEDNVFVYHSGLSVDDLL